MNAVQHIGFNCRDRDAQEAFYGKHFGFQRVRVFNAGTPGQFVMLRLGGVCLEFFQGKTDAGLKGGGQPVGFAHLAIAVPDLDAALDALRADGIQPDDIIDCSKIAEGMRVVFFNDPEGNRIELMQGYKDDPELV
jgi:catechol 2,3-dioxygenase-like lactoylglutathione lyase family enzyme